MQREISSFFGSPMRGWIVTMAMLGALGAAACGDDDGATDPCELWTCLERGECAVQHGEPVCFCDTGYTGSWCEQCDTGYVPDGSGSCAPFVSCADQDPCGDHGTCTDADGAARCECDDGWTGTLCDACYPGYHDDSAGACVLDASCLATSCAGHGTCDDSTGVVTCTCDAGYTGDHCETCATGYHDSGEGACLADATCQTDTCSGHGTCDDSTGVPTCTCASGYTGDHCETCAAGYHDDGTGTDTCALDEACAATSCAEHGTCDDTYGVVACTCDASYTGDHCETCAAGFHDDGTGTDHCVLDESCTASSCAGHGTCLDSYGVVACTCDASYTGDHCETCAAGFHDDGTGTDHCVLDESCTTDSCTGHGTCDDSTGVIQCACATGYTGDRCDGCAPGYHDDGSSTDPCVLDESCTASSCAGHGTCDDSTGVVLCTCDTGYTGDHCEGCYPGYETSLISGQCQIPCPQWNDIRCDGVCISPLDPENCGACGNDCGGDLCYQQGNEVVCGCPLEQPFVTYCGADCADLKSDPAHCGTCDQACDTDEYCYDGHCVLNDPSCGATCYTGDVCCGGVCMWDHDFEGDENNCGACGVQCDANETCLQGHCVAGDGTCSGSCNPDYQVCCNNTCLHEWDVLSSVSHCGGCGITCGAHEQCSDATCVCEAGAVDCGSGCIDTWFDDANCGGCGLACSGGEHCVGGHCEADSGTCTPGCDADELCCQDPPFADACFAPADLMSDEEHCGGCAPCATGEQCVNGQCLCNYYPGAYCNGVCTNLASPEHCGACDEACPAGFSCAPGSGCYCDFDKTQCGNDCVDTYFSEDHCGACFNACDANEKCIGECRTETGTACTGCDESSLCCAGSGGDECVPWYTMQSSMQNCGGCGIACDPSTEVCYQGVCQAPPGDTCTSALGTYWFDTIQVSTCPYTASGLATSDCSPAQAGTTADVFLAFVVDMPGTPWTIHVETTDSALSNAVVLVYRVASSATDVCDTSDVLACGSVNSDISIGAQADNTVIALDIYDPDANDCGDITVDLSPF